MPADAAQWIETAGRIMIAALFLFQAFGALQRLDFHIGRLRSRRVPAPAIVLGFGLAMMLIGGAMVLVNIYAGIGAALLFVFTVTATVLFQNFWSIKEPDRRREKRTSFMYNLAIIGGILLVMARGAWLGG